MVSLEVELGGVELDEGGLDVGGAAGFLGQLRRVRYRNFLEFPIALCPLWTLQVRSRAVNSMGLISDMSSRFPTRCRCS
jgi:hypothetical protein